MYVNKKNFIIYKGRSVKYKSVDNYSWCFENKSGIFINFFKSKISEIFQLKPIWNFLGLNINLLERFEFCEQISEKISHSKNLTKIQSKHQTLPKYAKKNFVFFYKRETLVCFLIKESNWSYEIKYKFWIFFKRNLF